MTTVKLMNQPESFGIKFLTNVCLSLQLARLVPEETAAFFDGELMFPTEDATGNEIEKLDEVICSLPILPQEHLENFKA
jgi:hypothetical protein